MLTTTSHYHPPQCSPSQHEAYIFTPVTSPAAVAALPGQDDDKREGLEYSAEPYYRNHYQMSLEISKDEDEYFKPPADINVSLPATNGTQALSVPTSLHSTHGFTSDDSLVLPRTFYNTDQQLFPISSFQQQAPPPSLSIIRHPEHHQSSIQHSKASESLTTAYTSTASTVSTAPARSLPLTYPFLVAPTDATGPYAQPSPSPSASSVAP
ncbi:hypothetical protein BX666DRAFT_911152 [Dichotomocladium elegans]|nr:hypothetical protein BX666DRAFT_911152 [Dichotomocladium elegans]